MVFAIVSNPRDSPNLMNAARRSRNIHIIRADLRDTSEVQLAVGLITNETDGTLDVFIHAADWADESPTVTLDDVETTTEEVKAAFDRSFDQNVRHLLRQLDAFVPLLQKGQLKKFVVLSSVLTDVENICKKGQCRSLSLATSRAAVDALMLNYAAEYGDDEICFLLLSSTWVDVSRKI